MQFASTKQCRKLKTNWMNHVYEKRNQGKCKRILVPLGSVYVYRKTEKEMWYD
jgi:hypothetical protein